MKFVTKEHWLGWNSRDDKISKWAEESSRQNLEKYSEQLAALRTRLSKRNFTFFKESLHDARLIAFSVGDGLHLDFESKQSVSINDFYKTSVSIKVLNAEFDAFYNLKYDKVTKAVFDFPSDSPLWGKNVDDWGYDELSEVNEITLRHEVLFSSGTTILIEFEKFSFMKQPNKGSRCRKNA